MHTKSRNNRLGALAVVAALAFAACSGSATPSPAASTAAAPSAAAPSAAAPSAAAPSAAAPSAAAPSPSAAANSIFTATDCTGATPNAFFDAKECAKQLQNRFVTPTGPADQPWIQAINPTMVDTAKYKKDGPYKICVSESGEDNPWRVVGYNDMVHEAQIQGVTLDHVVANGKDDKQISDISDLVKNGNCSALVISPNSTAALTPAVAQACQSNIPIVVWDRGVTTDCPVTFIHPIGGYVFGADAAEYLVSVLKPGAKIIALRILPGVDVLETRWLAAEAIFKQHNITVVDSQFDNGDGAKAKQIVSDDIDKFGTIDGVWMDAGAVSVAASEAFTDKGLPMPPITGEDQNDFLTAWSKNNYNWMAPTYPTYQWRTAIIAAVDILKGQQVPKEWILPQPAITKDNLQQYLSPNMPPLFYGLCGCQKMPGFPADWQKAGS
jgi:ribose transport system substrate-binding protein